MKKIVLSIVTITVLLFTASSQASWFGNNNWGPGGGNGWSNGWNPYDEWDPRYWVREMDNQFSDNDYNGPGYGYGGSGYGHGGSGYGGPGYGYGGPGYGSPGYGYGGPGYGGPGYGYGRPAPYGYGPAPYGYGSAAPQQAPARR